MVHRFHDARAILGVDGAFPPVAQGRVAGRAGKCTPLLVHIETVAPSIGSEYSDWGDLRQQTEEELALLEGFGRLHALGNVTRQGEDDVAPP